MGKRFVFKHAVPVLLAIGLLGQSSALGSPSIESQIRSDLQRRKSSDFSKMASDWKKRFNTSAVDPLLKIADDRRLEDSSRYIAVMSAVRLGGVPVAARIAVLLKDPSWMLRSAALRSLAMLEAGAQGTQTLALLKDPALVVRTEAVDTVKKLRPAGAVSALVDTLENPSNYHAGRAQWVPQKALMALIELKAPASIASRIAPLLKRTGDPDLQRTAVMTLENVVGKKLKHGAPLSEKIRAWNAEFKAKQS